MTSTGLLILASGFALMAIASLPEAARRMRGIFYGWFMAGLGALLMALCVVPLFGALPVWNPVLRNTFGWTAGQMSWAFSMTQVQEGSLGPVVGLLVDKLGPRRMVLIGLIILGSGWVLFSQIRELWQLYVVFIIMSLGASSSSWLPMMTVVNHWFIRRRALAMSVTMEGFAVGGVVVPLLLAWAIGGIDPAVSERYGWRTTALVIGILCLAVAVPLSRLIRNRPKELGLNPDGDPPVAATPSLVDASVTPSEIAEAGYTWQEAIRTKAFWLIGWGHATTTIVLGTILVHLGLMLDDRGFSLQTISAVVATYTTVSALLIPVGGYLGDRLPIRLVAFGFSALQPVAMLVLVLANDNEMLFLFAALFGVAIGGRTPLTTALRGAYFGRRAFGAITGMSMVPMNILLVIVPVYAGFMRDVTGTYDVSFLSIGAVALFGSFLFLLLGEPPRLPAPAARSSQAAD